MIKSSAIEILKTFSDNELELFDEFIQTPFHNKNVKLTDCFKLLKKFHPEYSGEGLTKEHLYRELTGSKRYKDTYMRNLFSDLSNIAEKFLQYNLISKDKTHERLLIEEIKNRDLTELAEKKIRSFEKEINSTKIKDHDYYQNKNFIYEMKSFLIVDKTLTDSFRAEQMASIMKLFMISLMENSFYQRVEEQRVSVKHRFDFLKHVLKYIDDHIPDFEDSPLLMIYYYLWQCYFYDDNESNFLKAKSYFKKHFSSLTKIDRRNIYSVMQVYYINKIDRGETEYNKEFLEFLLEMLKFNVLSHKEKDFIGLNLYRNILILCTILNETEILKKFISKYINFIDKQSREAILAYSNSHLYFLQGNFEKALELCNHINLNDLLQTANDNLFFKKDIKTLTMKCLVELNALEQAISHIDAFKHFLKNSKMIRDEVKKKYLNFLYFVNQLIRLRIDFDESTLAQVKKKFTNTRELIYSDWISAKLKELEKNS